MQLDERKRKVLQGVVWSYVETAEPVGSENLAQKYSYWGVKSATIRNTLADLSDLGYLKQPHTSSGRIPSDQGYRFYVDHLIVQDSPNQEIADDTRGLLELQRAETLDRILRHTCSLLSRLTNYASVATKPRPAEVRLKQAFALPAGDHLVLFIALLSTADSETKLLSGSIAALAQEDTAAATAAINALNSQWSGKSLSAIHGASTSSAAPPVDLLGLNERAIYIRFMETLTQIVADALSRGVVFEGARQMFKLPEFHDVEKLEPVLSTLQMAPHFVDDLVEDSQTGVVTVVIGSEHQHDVLKECSVVTAPYSIGQRERGSLGVIGPTRMDYDKTIPAVSFMARSLSDLLTHIS
jgi:heat-inducible transcriptional repressor